MKTTNLSMLVLAGSLVIADLKEGQHIDHVLESTHEVQTSLIVSYGYNAQITGSFQP